MKLPVWPYLEFPVSYVNNVRWQEHCSVLAMLCACSIRVIRVNAVTIAVGVFVASGMRPYQCWETLALSISLANLNRAAKCLAGHILPQRCCFPCMILWKKVTGDQSSADLMALTQSDTKLHDHHSTMCAALLTSAVKSAHCSYN